MRYVQRMVSSRVRSRALVFAMLCSLLFAWSVVANSTHNARANGCITPAAGTEADPFLIASYVELECMLGDAGYYWNQGYYFKQTADIDLASRPDWTHGIGDDAITFDGTYDGNGFSIDNLTVTDDTKVGMFGVTEGATLTDITLNDVTVEGTGIVPLTTITYVGGLVGVATANTTISGVSVSGTIDSYALTVGGIAGQAGTGTTITGSTSSAEITITSIYQGFAGGLVGRSDPDGDLTIVDSFAVGNVNAGGSSGGLIGRIDAPTTITGSYATGDISGVTLGMSPMGGLVGWAMTDDTHQNVIRESFATGSVTTVNGYVGGIVGRAGFQNTPATYSGLSIIDSFATGTLTTGGAASPVGGILGDAVTTTGNGVTLTRTYSTSVINPASSTSPPPAVLPGGGILAQATNAADASITASFWNATNAGAGATSSYGTESTQSAMRTTGLYGSAGWDIVGQTSADYTWGMCSTAVNGGFPFLQWYATSQGWSCSVPSPPPTPIPAAAPASVAGVGGDSSALITWSSPDSSGSFPVTNYQVVGSPSGSCLVPAATLSCEISGLRNGVEYSFRVRALTGAGWGAWSDAVTVVPEPPAPEPSIVISGSRSGNAVIVNGVTTGLVGAEVTPWVRFPGPHSYEAGSGVRTVAADGTFSWQRQTRKKIYVYFRAGEVRSNRVIIR